MMSDRFYVCNRCGKVFSYLDYSIHSFRLFINESGNQIHICEDCYKKLSQCCNEIRDYNSVLAVMALECKLEDLPF